MRGSKALHRHPGWRGVDDDRATGGDVESLEYDEDNDLPDLIMDIEDDVLDEGDYEEVEIQRASAGEKRVQTIFTALAIAGVVACVVLLCLVAYFATNYVHASEDLNIVRDSLQNATESFLKLQNQAQLKDQQDCTRFQNTTEHWLHLFCEKYECPSSICDPGWVKYSRSCFLLMDTRLSWEQSREMCSSKQGHLAIANNDQVQDAVPLPQNFLFEQAKEASYWIGMTDSVTEGIWMWVDGTKVMDGKTVWGPGQPDNAFSRMYRMRENCGLMRLWRWYDEACGARLPAICEKNAIRLHLIFHRMMQSR
ncbi:C-type lectin domain family 4 member A-like [Carcharodon carcharias]|uniref:C-type lectin domain family 4 member A-like n=1 Tax=Carcharodon carcharias TaxID=13397 RepID=UPI001B7E2F2C|nr:C-type lectin domain family 4 member A-like [Carcharodon carcharias]